MGQRDNRWETLLVLVLNGWVMLRNIEMTQHTIAGQHTNCLAAIGLPYVCLRPTGMCVKAVVYATDSSSAASW